VAGFGEDIEQARPPHIVKRPVQRRAGQSLELKHLRACFEQRALARVEARKAWEVDAGHLLRVDGEGLLDPGRAARLHVREAARRHIGRRIDLPAVKPVRRPEQVRQGNRPRGLHHAGQPPVGQAPSFEQNVDGLVQMLAITVCEMEFDLSRAIHAYQL
jgi:hypothetical protein